MSNMFKVNSKDWRRSGVCNVNFEHICHLFQLFLLFTLSMCLFPGWFLHDESTDFKSAKVLLNQIENAKSIFVLSHFVRLDFYKFAIRINLVTNRITVLKLVSAIFYQIFIFHQMTALQKLWKMFFISSKKLFRSRDIQIFVFPSSPFFPCQTLL